MDIQLLQFLVDGGGTAFLIYLIIRLLERIDVVTDRILDNNEQASAERQVIATELGLSTQDLSSAAQSVRRKRKL